MPVSLSQGWASIGATLLAHGFLPARSNYWINTAMTAAIADDKFTKASLAAFVSAARSTLLAARCAAPEIALPCRHGVSHGGRRGADYRVPFVC